MNFEIRNPKQQRAIIKKEKIIDAGFLLICKNGYYNTNTKEIAEKANVSTGIVYQYFKDKHDIFIAGLYKYGNEIFYPMIKLPKEKIIKDNYKKIIRNMIESYIKNHKLSSTAHEEIMSMTHSDDDVREFFYKNEIETTKKITKFLLENNFKEENLYLKVHIMLGLIDNLCHEVVYHKHNDMDYNKMTDMIIDTIYNLFKENITS